MKALLLRFAEKRNRIDSPAFLPDFEMKLRRRDRAGLADFRDDLAFSDLIAFFDQHGVIMRIGRDETVGVLHKKQIAEARRKMQGLKLHPRDALPNVTALNRADARFAESSGPARQELGAAIAELRAALEQQDPESIVIARSGLLQLLESGKDRR